MSGIEIEIKLQLTENDYNKITVFLSNSATVRARKHQIDVYYSPEGVSFYDSGDRCLRVRKEAENTILSYKRIYEENTDKQFIEEFETSVDSFDMVDNILKALRFRREIIVDKYRQEFLTANGLLVALDRVLDLGYFMEIENQNEQDDLVKRNQDLYDFVRELNLDIMNRNTEGYSNMLFRKNRIQGEYDV